MFQAKLEQRKRGLGSKTRNILGKYRRGAVTAKDANERTRRCGAKTADRETTSQS